MSKEGKYIEIEILIDSLHANQVAQSCLTDSNLLDCSPPGSSPWDSPGKNIGVGCHSLLQGIFGIFSTQGSKLHLLCLLHWRQVLYHQWLSLGEW